jgi:hypothetical protein
LILGEAPERLKNSEVTAAAMISSRVHIAMVFLSMQNLWVTQSVCANKHLRQCAASVPLAET